MNKQSITFSASEQTLEKLTGSEQFAGNTVSYVEATFTLGTNWTGFDSVSAVWKSQYYEIATVLDAYGKCDVPAEVMYYKSKVFVNLVGVSVSGDEITDRLTTYPTLAFTIDSDSAVEGTETTDITPSQFDQFVSQVSDDASAAAASAAAAAASAASLTVDSALSPSSTNPVQNKVINGAITDLKEDLYPMANETYHPIVGGRIYNGLGAGQVVDVTPQANANYAYLVVPVLKNDKFIITGSGNSSYRPVCFTDENYAVISNGGTSFTNEVFHAPADGYLISTFDISNPYSVVKTGDYTLFKEDASERIKYLESLMGEVYEPSEYTNGYSIYTGYGTGTSGAGVQIDPTPSVDANFAYIIIECAKDDVFKITGKGGVTARAWAFTDADYKLVMNSASSITITDEIVIAPSDGYLILNTYAIEDHKATLQKQEIPDLIYVKPNAAETETVFNKIIDAVAYANKRPNTTILVDSGTYDIIEELGGSEYTENLSGTSTYAGGISLGNNTTIIGAGSDVKLTANYAPATNPIMTDRFSIFNIIGSFHLVNLEFEVTNVRYCIHEDMAALAQANRPAFYTAEYKNCKMKHNGSSSTTYNQPQCIGGGTMNKSLHIIDGCELESPNNINPASYHNNATTNNGVANVLLKNNYFANNGTIALAIYDASTQVINADICGNRFGRTIIDNSSGLFNIKEWNNIIA